MANRILKRGGPLTVLAFALLIMLPTGADAVIQGLTGTTFNLTAKDGYISTADGGSVYMWGYSNGAADMQYPGPTLILSQGASVTINLSNELSENVSIIFPGIEGVAASGGVQGLLTREAPPGGSVTYSFTASNPGTYHYHSGTRPDLQIEMGMVGAIIVRPTMGANFAYNDFNTQFNHEYLFLLTDMDPEIHNLVELGRMDLVDNNTFWPVLWFINGRNAPDTMSPVNAVWLPNQPYNCMPRLRPGEKILLRFINAGRDLHPFHTHGNNFWAIARDGKLLESVSGAGTGPDLAESNFTLKAIPGETVDATFEWTGYGMGWDIYGHAPGDPLEPNEYGPDHGKPFPVDLPVAADLTFGAMWSGSPFLGALGALPPGEGGMNMFGGYFFMWHSHTEKEMTNYDIFPGGMMTMFIVEPPGTPIP